MDNGARRAGAPEKALTPRSSSAHSRLTSLLLMPSIPRVRTRASTLRVLTPWTYASWTTATRARSARRRGSISQPGKYEPRRSLGMSSSIVPARVSQSRVRWPLRYPRRSGVRSWGSAPGRAATSISISASAMVFTALRRKSTSPPAAAFPTSASSAILSVAIVWSPLQLTSDICWKTTRWPSSSRPSIYTTRWDTTPGQVGNAVTRATFHLK